MKILSKWAAGGVLLLAATMTSTLAQAASEEVAGASTGGGWQSAIMALAIALGIGIAAFGGALGQSRAAVAALEGISRNPSAADKVFVPMILGLAFIESLVLFTWVLMFLMSGKL